HLFADLSIPPDATGSLPRELRGVRAGLAAEAEEDLGETGHTRTRRRSAGGRSRRARSRRSGDGVQALTDSGSEAGGDAEPRAPRRRRRTRGGRDVNHEAAAESAPPPESTQQAS
ncbi:MAG TPA: hypothetical protein VH594_26745, partial [Trebonia sp.]